VHEKGFEGRLVILGEPEIVRGDCHIEWADGGILRDRKALERRDRQRASGRICRRGPRALKAHKAQAEPSRGKGNRRMSDEQDAGIPLDELEAPDRHGSLDG
jgi:hypothetical protein